MLVRDEADVIEHTIHHLLLEGVERVYVLDNGSTDGTSEILAGLDGERVVVEADPVVGYWQSEKTTGMALRALEDGFDWVIPCDADEWWYSLFGTLHTVLNRHDHMGFDVVKAELYNHMPSGRDDPEDPNPFSRIGWRLREVGELPKVACRLRPDITIAMGNHSVSYRLPSHPRADAALTIRHFSWRSEDQYVRKIRNGYEAYSATSLDQSFGQHWRQFGPPMESTWEERVLAWYHRWGYIGDPSAEPDKFVFDPILTGRFAR